MNTCPITTPDLGKAAKWSRRPTELGLGQKGSHVSATHAPVVSSRAGGRMMVSSWPNNYCGSHFGIPYRKCLCHLYWTFSNVGHDKRKQQSKWPLAYYK